MHSGCRCQIWAHLSSYNFAIVEIKGCPHLAVWTLDETKGPSFLWEPTSERLPENPDKEKLSWVCAKIFSSAQRLRFTVTVTESLSFGLDSADELVHSTSKELLNARRLNRGHSVPFCMVYHFSKRLMICACGDGTLSVITALATARSPLFSTARSYVSSLSRIDSDS